MKKLLLIVIAVAAIFMCSCNQNRSANLHLNNQYLVGGGFHIDYTAPVDGTAILIDAASGKHIATETLSEGQNFEMDLPIDDPEELEKLNAVLDVKKLNPRLYFVPIEKQVPQAK
jgi:hypothetical protein